MVQLLGMVLDFLDALAGAVAIACWWCTWVQPAKPPSDPAELDRFVQAARTSTGAESPDRPPPNIASCRPQAAASDPAFGAEELSAKGPLSH
ncbi:MAG TPA: hypothetical protein VFV80_05510 [Geminicoccaceae bacterium]|nr:hypothetical protein [Geminicoccaceae bacterium]